MTVRLVTYHLPGLAVDAERVAGVLRDLSADIVCLQQAPRRLGWRTRAADLARRAGLVYVTGGRPTAGTMLLCARRAFVARQSNVPLPSTPGLHRCGLAAAVFRIGQRQLAVGSVHLGVNGSERQRHLDLVLPRMRALAERYGVPYLLAGHVNEHQDGAAWRRLSGELRDAYALAQNGGAVQPAPARRVDAVFVSDGVEVAGCCVPDVPGAATGRDSDHRPVQADLRLASP